MSLLRWPISTIFQGILSGCDLEKLVLPFTLLTGIYIFMFLSNFFAQQIIDHNNHVFTTAYNVPWYITPLCIQKLILFILQRGTKVLNMKLAKIFVGSLEGFATMMSASVSYFTVLYSIGK